MENGTCKEHSGFKARLYALEIENTDQWGKFNTMDQRINSIFTRLNIILGGIIVACIMLAINIIITKI